MNFFNVVVHYQIYQSIFGFSKISVSWQFVFILINKVWDVIFNKLYRKYTTANMQLHILYNIIINRVISYYTFEYDQ